MTTKSISDVVRAWLLAPILEELQRMEHKMSVLSDAIAAVSTAVAGLGTQIQTAAADLTAEIVAINEKIAAGTVTQADLDNLTAIATTLNGLSANVTQIDTSIKAIVP